MSDKLKLILGGVIFAVVVILFETMFIINQTEQAIVLQFGEPIREIKQAGLKFKIPFIQKVVVYDNRLLNLEPPAQEVVLNDKKRLDVDNFTRYRIVDPLKFYQTVRNEYQARSKLEEIVNSSVRKVLGRITLQELLSSKRTQIMADISKAVKVDAEQIGVMAVERALKGESGKVMYFKRVSNSPYTVVIDSIDAAEIANKVKYFPLGWINSSGNNVTDEAVDYILPLIQGEQDIHYLNGMPIHFKLGN